MARDAGNIQYKGNWKGWALKWQRAKRVPFGPKKPSNEFALIKIIKSKRHINRYIGNFMCLSSCILCSAKVTLRRYLLPPPLPQAVAST